MPLCTHCKSLSLPLFAANYRPYRPLPIPHHPTYASLRNSAATCEGCALFYQESNADSKYPDKEPICEEHAVRLYGRTGRDGWPRRYVVDGKEGGFEGLLGIRVAVEDSGDDVGGVSYWRDLEVVVAEDAPPHLKAIVLPRPVNNIDNLRIPSKWLQDCMTNHAGCRLPGKDLRDSLLKEFSSMPTRVIDCGLPDGSQEPKLIEPQGKPGAYLALSHCWGTEKVSTTTTVNVSAHKISLPLSSLSANFRDAVLVTKNLGFQYLWIDSLCILQDSAEDWEVESSKMAKVYQSALLTISAANSPGATHGFMKSRPSIEHNSVSFPDATGGSFYLKVPYSSYAEDVDAGPLAIRGWTLQERVLSRRNVFFGATQSHWECKSARYSENTPTALQAANDIAAGVSSLGSLYALSQTASSDGLRGVMNLWYDIVGEFTKRYLTVGDDRLPALSGIANVFNRTLGMENAYLAGIWKQDLARGLLWKNFGPTVEMQRKMRNPSWSWSSMDGPVQFGRELKSQVVDLPNGQVTTTRGMDEFGRVESAKLMVKGKLGVVPQIERMGPDFQNGKDVPYMLTNAVLRDDAGVEIGAGYLDDPAMELGACREKAYCLPVRHEKVEDLLVSKVDCLLLQKVAGSEKEYVRIGTATLSIMGGDRNQAVAPFQAFLDGAEQEDIVII